MRHERLGDAEVLGQMADAQLLVGEGYNHFEIIETFASPYGICGRAALRLFGLTVE